VILTKHEALGNDFLVVFDDQPLGGVPLATLAARLCHRRRGVGADGLIVAHAPAADGDELSMTLFNADGGRAEMSGNGIRCLAQAWARRQGVSQATLVVRTDGGRRKVEVLPGDRPHTVLATVGMGVVSVIDPPPGWARVGCGAARAVAHLSLGNPHAVLAVDDVGAVDLAALGALVPDVNLEIVAPGSDPSAVAMRVHERGAGITEACGTGAVAAAWAAAAWGLAVGPEITVHMPGGDAIVRLDTDGAGEVVLIGACTFIATIEAAA
jgi:diaminopimelate epimerase